MPFAQPLRLWVRQYLSAHPARWPLGEIRRLARENRGLVIRNRALELHTDNQAASIERLTRRLDGPFPWVREAQTQVFGQVFVGLVAAVGWVWVWAWAKGRRDHDGEGRD